MQARFLEGSFAFNVDPDAGVVVNATTGEDQIYGSTADDNILAGDGDDEIFAREGEDRIIAGIGQDTINLFESDGVTVDGETDIIDYDGIDEIGDNDLVAGFDVTAPGIGGDQIDLSDVLDFSGTVADAELDGSIQFVSANGGADTEIWVDKDGSGGGANSLELALTLQGVSFNDVTNLNVIDDNIIL